MERNHAPGELAGLAAEAALNGRKDLAEQAARQRYLLEQQGQRRKEQCGERVDREAERLRDAADAELVRIAQIEARSRRRGLRRPTDIREGTGRWVCMTVRRFAGRRRR